MKITSRRLYIILLALIGLLLLALPVSAYEISGLLASRSDVKLKAKSEALDQEQQSFEVAQQSIKKYSNLEKIAKAIVPQDKSQAEAVREIVNIASENGVTLASISFPPSTLGGGIGPSSSGSNSQSKPSASNLNNSQNKLSQLTAVNGMPGVYQLPITITSDRKNPILYNQLINFLSDLEYNRRTAQVDSININPVGGGQYLTFDITLNEYIKP